MSWRLPETPPRLAVRGALTDSESRRGRDPEHESLVPPYSITESRPGTLGRREVHAVLRLECAGDASEFGGAAHLCRLALTTRSSPSSLLQPVVRTQCGLRARFTEFIGARPAIPRPVQVSGPFRRGEWPPHRL